mgnify:CR=1 FL=1
MLVASTLAGALEELPYSFADLPLRDFERKPEASQAAVFLLQRPGQLTVWHGQRSAEAEREGARAAAPGSATQ